MEGLLLLYILWLLFTRQYHRDAGEESQEEDNCAPARRDQAEAHVDVVRLAAAATDEMWKENQGDEEDWRLEVEGEAEVSVVEFRKKNEKREQASHRKRKSRKMK